MATGTLTGQTIANTYKALLKITGTTAGGETLHATTQKVIEDGDGNPFPFSAAQDAILMTGTSRIEFNDAGEYISGDGTDLTITSSAKINLTATSDVHIANGTGFVVGNTAQVAMGEVTAEAQILGTTETDATLAIGLFSTTDALSPSLKFVKGAHASIGTHSTTVADNEELGKIQAYGSDATDSDTLSSEIAFNIDDDGVGTGTLGGEILLKTSGKDGALDTAVVINSVQNVGIADIDPSEARLSIGSVEAGDYGIKIVNANATSGIFIDMNSTGGGSAIEIDTEATTGVAIFIDGPGTTTVPVLKIACADALTTGNVAHFESNASNTSTRDLVQIINNNTAATGATCLKIQQDSTGPAIDAGGGYMVNEQGRQDHVANTMSAPYYRFDGVNDVITVADDADLDWGSGDGAIELLIYFPVVSSSDLFIITRLTDANNRLMVYYDGPNLEILFTSGSTVMANAKTTWTATAERWYHIVWTFENGVSNQIYINGVSQTLDLVNSYTGGAMNLAVAMEFGKYSSTYSQIVLGKVKHWNVHLSATEVKELYSGASVPFKYKGANQTDVVTNGAFASDSGWTKESGWTIAGGLGVCATSSTAAIYQTAFTTGKKYRVTYTVSAYSSGGVYWDSQGGAATGVADTDGTLRSANGTYTEELVVKGTLLVFRGKTGVTTDLKIDNVSAVQIGAVAEYDGSGVGAATWDDKSGNDLHGAVSGATVENAPADADSGLTYEEGTFTPAFTAGSGTITIDSSYDTGLYTKIGRLVSITGGFGVSAISSPSGELNMTGLPFTCKAATEYDSIGAGAVYLRDAATDITNYVTGFVNQNSTNFVIREGGTTGAGSDLANHIDTGTLIHVNLQYFV
jgi:hypothetical protein